MSNRAHRVRSCARQRAHVLRLKSRTQKRKLIRHVASRGQREPRVCGFFKRNRGAVSAEAGDTNTAHAMVAVLAARGPILGSAVAACSSSRAARAGGGDAGRARGARHVARAGELQVWNAEEAEMSFLCGSSAVVSFGTTWCGPCAVLAPELATLAAALEDVPSLEDLDIAKVCLLYTSPSPRDRG